MTWGQITSAILYLFETRKNLLDSNKLKSFKAILKLSTSDENSNFESLEVIFDLFVELLSILIDPENNWQNNQSGYLNNSICNLIGSLESLVGPILSSIVPENGYKNYIKNGSIKLIAVLLSSNSYVHRKLVTIILKSYALKRLEGDSRANHVGAISIFLRRARLYFLL